MKEKNEERATNYVTRREWMSRITIYLITILIGLALMATSFDDPLGRFSWVFGIFAGATTAFVLIYVIPDQPPDYNDIQIIMVFVGCGGSIVVSVLVQAVLLRLGG